MKNRDFQFSQVKRSSRATRLMLRVNSSTRISSTSEIEIVEAIKTFQKTFLGESGTS